MNLDDINLHFSTVSLTIRDEISCRLHIGHQEKLCFICLTNEVNTSVKRIKSKASGCDKIDVNMLLVRASYTNLWLLI